MKRQSTWLQAETDDVSIYLNDIGHRPLLSAEEEKQLAQQIEASRAEQEKPMSCRDRLVIETGQQAHRSFVEANMRLVVNQVRQFLRSASTTPALGFLDLIQEGNIGLLHALEKFDYRKGYKFSTFATWWIRQALQRAHHNQSRLVRLPVYESERLSRIKHVSAQLSELLGVSPTAEEIADAMKLPVTTVLGVLAHDYKSVSLEKPLNGAKDQSLGSLLEQEREDFTNQAAQNVVSEEVRAALNQAGLTARERQVIELRYGFQGDECSLEEVARTIKPTVSRERIRQIEAAALRKLRSFLCSACDAVA